MIRGDELTTKITNNKNGQINIILDNHKVTNHLNERNHLFKKNPFSHIDEAFSSIVGMSALKEKKFKKFMQQLSLIRNEVNLVYTVKNKYFICYLKEIRVQVKQQ